MNDLFEQAKQAVAVENGYSDWGQVLRICDYEDVYRMMEEVFKVGCNESVKIDRDDLQLAFDHLNIEAGSVIRNRPLPFPQQPDGI